VGIRVQEGFAGAFKGEGRGSRGCALGEGRRGSWRPLHGRCCEEEERKEEGGAARWGRCVSEREREGERERAELAAEAGGVRELGRAWGEKWAVRGEKVGRRRTGLLVGLLLYFPFLFLFQTQTQTY
jgi:hypothetical protein